MSPNFFLHKFFYTSSWKKRSPPWWWKNTLAQKIYTYYYTIQHQSSWGWKNCWNIVEMHTPRRLDQHHVKTLRTSKIRLSNDFTEKNAQSKLLNYYQYSAANYYCCCCSKFRKKNKKKQYPLFVKKLALCVSLTSSYFFPAPWLNNFC